MKIKTDTASYEVDEHEVGDEDCSRVDYSIVVNETRVYLTCSALPCSEYTDETIETRAKEIFGPSAQISS